MKFTQIIAKLLVLTSLLLGFADQVRGQNTQLTIPTSIRECYGNDDLYSRQNRLPMTMSTLIELIRKVELHRGTYMDMRTMSVALLHRFRMDGFERIPGIPATPGVVPFRMSGEQFIKHQILFQQLIPGHAFTFPNDSLTVQEQCALHFMLSSAVDPWERSDELQICPMTPQTLPPGSSSNRQNNRTGAQLSRCPIEDGVVLTSRWGTVSPGTVLAAIAAALEPQEVQISLLLTEPVQSNDTDVVEKFDRYRAMSQTAPILNTWAATLAGDLAEVAVYQAPRRQGDLYIGPDGTWNDTVIPRARYMNMTAGAADLWQMTDAEGRGGIDGLILSGVVKSWQDRMNRLRLSQVLEMYYSQRGVSFEPQFRACDRQARLRELLATENQLPIQTTNFARVLSYKAPQAVHISDDRLEEFSIRAVQAFNSHLPTLFSEIQCDAPTAPPRVHLNVILDGTWTPHEGMRVLAHLAQEADVSHFGSCMTVINGEDGSWIVPQIRNVSALFTLRNNTENVSEITWPRSLNLQLSLATYSNYLAEKLAEERIRNVIGGASYVVLVLGFRATISDIDFTESSQIITRFKRENPDVRFVYLASELNQNRFRELSAVDPNYPDEIIASPDSSVQTVIPRIISSISSIPGRIMGPNCGSSNDQNRTGFEDYVTPGFPMTYRIHTNFFGTTGDINLRFQGSGQGDLRMCVSREQSAVGTTCAEVRELEQATLTIPAPCATYGNRCPPIFLNVEVTRTLTHCSENDCRFPDQVRFLMRHEGLQCFKIPTSPSSNTATALQSNMKVSLHVAINTLSLLLVSYVIGNF